MLDWRRPTVRRLWGRTHTLCRSRDPVPAGLRQIFLAELPTEAVVPTWFSEGWALFLATAGEAAMIAADRMLNVMVRMYSLPIDIP